MTGTSVALVLAVFAIGGAIAAGIVTGLVASIGFGFLLYKTKTYKPRIWNTMMDHPLATDIILSLGAVALIGTATFGGLAAGISCGVFASSGISLANKYVGKVEGIESYKFKIPRSNKNTELSTFG